MKRASPSWEIYERMIARLTADQLSTDFCVTPNARLVGKISGRSRQIDVLIDARHDTDNTRRIIIDAKKRKRKIDITDVEALRGLMEDVGATHGYLISPAGYTKAAERRSQEAVSIRIVPLDRMEDFDPSSWPRCRNDRCKHGRILWDGYPEIFMTLASPTGPQNISVLHYVGKCDRCGQFHVRCFACDDILSIPDNDEDDIGHQCRCRQPWFWIASIESDEAENESSELHAVLAGQVITVSRRSL